LTSTPAAGKLLLTPIRDPSGGEGLPANRRTLTLGLMPSRYLFIAIVALLAALAGATTGAAQDESQQVRVERVAAGSAECPITLQEADLPADEPPTICFKVTAPGVAPADIPRQVVQRQACGLLSPDERAQDALCQPDPHAR
jgi:hypothetical protein